MNLKFYILILLLVSIFGFVKYPDVKSIPEGEWIMCKTICDQIEINFNQCTEIYLIENGEGIIKKPGGKSNFSWKVRD